MGRIRLCIHEYPAILHLEPGQKHDQQGKRDQPKEDPVKHQYDLRIPRSHPILHKNKIPRDHQQYALICGGMIGPLSMIVTGMLIAEVNLKDIFTNKRVYLVTVLRLIIQPLIALAVINLLGMRGWHPQGDKIILITYLAAITPCASTVTQMCQVYGNDSKYASAINVMTTLLSIITMPVFVYLYQM